MNGLPAAWPYGRLTVDEEHITFHARFWWPSLFIQAKVFDRAHTLLHVSRVVGLTTVAPVGPAGRVKRVSFSRWFHSRELCDALRQRGWQMQRVNWRGHPT